METINSQSYLESTAANIISAHMGYVGAIY